MTLNPAQREAATARDPDILCLACAGAGKTRTLVERIAHAVETDTPPWAILALTFTNKAAEEMRERLAGRIGKARAAQVWMGTFHALGARMLRDFGAVAGFPDGFSIYDDADRLDVCLMVAHDLGIKLTAKEPSIEGIHGAADRAKRRVDFDRLYQATLRRYAATDYDGLETHLLALLHSPVVQAHVRRYREILVDEYQDTNEVQDLIIGALRAAVPGLRVFRVGDPSQSIYGFRGAKIENIIHAADRPETRVIRLDTNYRSGVAIVDAGNRIAAHTGSPLGAVRPAPDAESGIVAWIAHQDPEARAREVARLVATDMSRGCAPGDMMVLARTWKALTTVESELVALDIPCDMPKREADAWSSTPMRWLVAAMRLHVNPRDGIALRRVMRWPTLAASDLQLARADARGDTLSELRAMAPARLPIFDADSAGAFALMFAARSDAMETPIGMDTARAELRAAVARIVAWTERRIADDQPCDPRAFLAWWSFRDVRDGEAPPTEGGKVRLLTIHAAKGLESPVVHFVGPDLGVFPRPGEDPRGEELRIWYVAVTRARDAFVAHCSATAPTWGGRDADAGPSGFVQYLTDSKGTAS